MNLSLYNGKIRSTTYNNIMKLPDFSFAHKVRPCYYFFLMAGWLLSPDKTLCAFETLYDFSPASDALRPHAAYFVEAQSVLVDGQVTSFPPDKITYDRTLASYLRTGTKFSLANRLGLQLIADARYFIRKRYEAEEPRRIDQETWIEGWPTVNLSLTTIQGAELFAGSRVKMAPSHHRTIEAANFETDFYYRSAQLLIPHFGLWKKMAFARAALYFQPSAKTTRDVEKTASDGSVIKAQETLFSAEQFGLLAEFTFGGQPSSLEFTAIQARSSSPKVETTDQILFDDYMRFRASTQLKVDYNNIKLIYISLIHQTLSYADSSFISLETIPTTALHIKLIRGDMARHIYAGLVYGYAKDQQSLPEFNQKFLVQSYGAKLGAFIKF